MFKLKNDITQFALTELRNTIMHSTRSWKRQQSLNKKVLWEMDKDNQRPTLESENPKTQSKTALNNTIANSCNLYVIYTNAGNLIKACVCYFLSSFYFFIKWQAFKNYEKCFLFHLKSSFHSQVIPIFVIFCLPFHTFQIQNDKW